MTRDNVVLLQRAYEYFQERGRVHEALYHAEFVWDMSTFEGWPERQQYHGAGGAMEFLTDWISQWDDWAFEMKDMIDAGDRVVAICHQSGVSKLSGARADMDFAQVWTFRDGLLLRMEMYSDVGEALAQTGLAADADQRESDTMRRSAS